MIPKLPLSLLLSQLFIGKLKEGALHGLSIANPNFTEIAFFCWIFPQRHKVGYL
jgi:hypothetical protein